MLDLDKRALSGVPIKNAMNTNFTDSEMRNLFGLQFQRHLQSPPHSLPQQTTLRHRPQHIRWLRTHKRALERRREVDLGKHVPLHLPGLEVLMSSTLCR